MTEEIDVELSDRDWIDVLAPDIASHALADIPEPDRTMIFGAVLAFMENRVSQMDLGAPPEDAGSLGSSAPLLLGRSRYFVRLKKMLFDTIAQAVMIVLAQATAVAANPLAGVVVWSAATIKAFLALLSRGQRAEPLLRGG